MIYHLADSTPEYGGFLPLGWGEGGEKISRQLLSFIALRLYETPDLPLRHCSCSDNLPHGGIWPLEQLVDRHVLIGCIAIGIK